MYGPLTQMALESGGAIIMDRELATWVVTEHPEMQDILDAGLYSTLAVPIFSDDKPIAWFAINATGAAAYTAEDGILAERIVTQIAGVVANALLRAELQQNIAQRITLAEIGRLVSSSVELDDMYKTLAALIRGGIPFDRIVILRANLASTKLYPNTLKVSNTSPARLAVLYQSPTPQLRMSSQQARLPRSSRTRLKVKPFHPCRARVPLTGSSRWLSHHFSPRAAFLAVYRSVR